MLVGGDKVNRFRECREKRGFSQKYVAITLGIKPPQISKWESGQTVPSTDHLIDLADLYGVGIDYLLGRDDASPPSVLHESESAYTPDDARALMVCFHRLNEEGRRRLLDQARDLVEIPRYTQDATAVVS
jgi:transcriptional regulator with XRE-family HTH domain